MIDRPVLHWEAGDEWLEPCPCCGLCAWAGAFFLDLQTYLCHYCAQVEVDDAGTV
jgi:hypothetical protein